MQSFTVIKPTPLLASYIRHYWILQDDSDIPVTERTLPVGCVQMIFHKQKQLRINGQSLQPRAFICGQSLKFSDVESTGAIEMIVVVFQPHTAKVLLHIPANLFYEQNIPLNETEDIELSDLAKKIEDTSGVDQCIRLIEKFLIHRLCTHPGYNLKRIATVLDKIETQPLVNISQLSATACLCEKQLGRIFTENIGTTLKNFIRIVRIQKALNTMQRNPHIPFAQLAYECGFSDQSHMIKEFRHFSGYTPARYISACSPYSDYFS